MGNAWKRVFYKYYNGSKQIIDGGANGIEYRLGEKKTNIDCEFAGTAGIIVWSSRIDKWEAPNGNSSVTDAERAMILTDLQEALGVPIVVQDGS